MRRFLVTAHLWLGLIIGLVWALQGLTGAALVFHRELDRMSVAVPQPGPMASLDRVLTAARGQPVTTIGIADGRGDLLNVQVGEGGSRQLQVDAATARPLRERGYEPSTPFEGSAWRWVYLLHESLLLHDKGETLIGASGLLLFTSLSTGLWLGWPKRRQWRQAFGPARWRSLRAQLFGWHRLLGLTAGLVMLVAVPGGIWMVFAADLRPALAKVTAFQQPYKAQPVQALGRVIGPQAALVKAQAVFPGAAFVRVTMPTAKSPVYVVRLRQAGEIRAWSGVTSVTMDAASGRVLASYDAVRAPLANRLADAAFSVHGGEVAGLLGRLAIFFAGLSLPILYVTGIWSWARRRAAKRKPRQADVPQRPSPVVAARPTAAPTSTAERGKGGALADLP